MRGRVGFAVVGATLLAGAACSLVVDTTGLEGRAASGSPEAAPADTSASDDAAPGDGGGRAGDGGERPGDASPDGEPCVRAPPDPSVLGSVLRVAVGNGFACAVTTDHAVVCWGQFYRGQFGFVPDSGDWRVSSTSRPLPVAGLGHDMVDVSAGDSHACAIDTGGRVWCWGFNNEGQLGAGEVLPDGGYPDASPQPSRVVSASGVLERAVAIGTGLNHSCALIQGGLVVCWGSNSDGQLGVPGGAGRRSTVAVLSSISPGGGAVDLTAADFCSCAVVQGSPSTVRCAGSNAKGQLGGDPSDSGVAVTMPLPPNATAPVAVAGSFYQSPHTLVLDSAGNVFGTGDNSGGALGAFDSVLPKAIPGLSSSNVVQIATGPTHSCARLREGTVQCLGSNWAGGLGRGFTSMIESDPAYVLAPESGPADGGAADGAARDGGSGGKVPLRGVVQVAVGYGQSCAIVQNACRSDGTVYCWGWNIAGEIGDGTRQDRSLPVRVLSP